MCVPLYVNSGYYYYYVCALGGECFPVDAIVLSVCIILCIFLCVSLSWSRLFLCVCVCELGSEGFCVRLIYVSVRVYMNICRFLWPRERRREAPAPLTTWNARLNGRRKGRTVASGK